MRLQWIYLAFLLICLSKLCNDGKESQVSIFTDSLHRFVCKTGVKRRSVFRGSAPHYLGLILMLAGDVCTNPGPNSLFAFSNVRSIKANYNSVKNFISAKKIDIFCMNETWLSNADTQALLSEITPPEFNLFHTPRISKKGGGVGIYINKNLPTKQHSVPSLVSFEAIAVSVYFTQCYNLFCQPVSASFITNCSVP